MTFRKLVLAGKVSPALVELYESRYNLASLYKLDSDFHRYKRVWISVFASWLGAFFLFVFALQAAVKMQYLPRSIILGYVALPISFFFFAGWCAKSHTKIIRTFPRCEGDPRDGFVRCYNLLVEYWPERFVVQGNRRIQAKVNPPNQIGVKEFRELAESYLVHLARQMLKRGNEISNMHIDGGPSDRKDVLIEIQRWKREEELFDETFQTFALFNLVRIKETYVNEARTSLHVTDWDPDNLFSQVEAIAPVEHIESKAENTPNKQQASA